MSGTEREQAIALLRAIANLLETGETVRPPRIDVDFWPRGGIAEVQAIAGALPVHWSGVSRSSGGTDYYDLQYPAPGAEYGLTGSRVTINIKAEDACTAAGQKTITVWEPSPAIAALLESTEGEAGEGE